MRIDLILEANNSGTRPALSTTKIHMGEMFKVLYYHPSYVAGTPPTIWVCANGPQMLRSAAKYADGIFVGDHTPEDVGRMRAIVDSECATVGRSTAGIRFNNFWAWHVKKTREEAHKEARRWLAIRATPYPAYGLTDISLRIYANPEWTIRLIGEKVIPALA